ncbi:MAG: hypothetical protein J5828_01665, partial [Desulfovibrionaceae bacterium]|nr:hypothetical protein [Desulfovibrionaceae bacterium]
LAQLDIEGTGSFFLERPEAGRGDTLLLYLAVTEERCAPETLLSCFRLCDVRKNLPFPLSFGRHRGRLFFLSRMRVRDVTAAAIENRLRFLVGCLDAGRAMQADF